MRERKGEYFLKIVNEERYQQLFDHPEELRKIITYAKRLMQYAKCFDYSFRDAEYSFGVGYGCPSEFLDYEPHPLSSF